MPGPVPFLFIAQEDNLFSIPLSGQNAGRWFDAKSIRIASSVFDNLTPNTPGTVGGSKSGVVVGVVCAVLVLIFGVIGCVWFKRRSARINRCNILRLTIM